MGLLGPVGCGSPSLILELWGVSDVGNLPGVFWFPAAVMTDESCDSRRMPLSVHLAREKPNLSPLPPPLRLEFSSFIQEYNSHVFVRLLLLGRYNEKGCILFRR